MFPCILNSGCVGLDHSGWRERSIDIQLGYLEQGALLSVVNGAVSRSSNGIDANGLGNSLQASAPALRFQPFLHGASNRQGVLMRVIEGKQMAHPLGILCVRAPSYPHPT